ncbi:MAG: ATP-dependent 6-phosphofructokinase [Verrucomicrobiota bacterium]
MNHSQKIHSIRAEDLKITNLGSCLIPSPINALFKEDLGELRFISDEDRVVFNDHILEMNALCARGEEIPSLELAGPRKNIYFDPAQSRCAIVTCGGLCPGLNDVVRGLVMQSYYRYGIQKIYGVPYGYEGFIAKYGHTARKLLPEDVADIQHLGGSILGTSRGDQDIGEIVNWLEDHQVNILFVVGGDGTLRGASDICKEIEKRGDKIVVVGIPKTIDNDIMWIDKSFGFDTAFTAAAESIRSAHVEALGVYNGIGLVKLMGRESGFITCNAALAMSYVNAVLIPEVPFQLHGDNGFLEWLHKRIDRRHHAVIVIAEGAGQELFEGERGKDASGNVKFHDIGVFLKKKIEEYFKSIHMPVYMKYFDPSYLIRSVPAAPKDSMFCSRLAQNAVHAAMCGKTNVLIGRWKMNFVHLPIPLVTAGRNRVDPNGDLWLSVLESTGQPFDFK